MSADHGSVACDEGRPGEAAKESRSATWLFAAATIAVIGAVGAWRLLSPDVATPAMQKPGYAAAAMAAAGKPAPAQRDPDAAADVPVTTAANPAANAAADSAAAASSLPAR